jgi:carboxymethylenebutenolidase
VTCTFRWFGSALPVLHGDADPVVPVSEAYGLERLLKQLGVPHEMRIYAGVGHSFSGATAEDAFRRITAFLTKHLTGGVSPG